MKATTFCAAMFFMCSIRLFNCYYVQGDRYSASAVICYSIYLYMQKFDILCICIYVFIYMSLGDQGEEANR